MSAPIFSAPLTIADNTRQEIELTNAEHDAIGNFNYLPPEYAPSGRKMPPCQKIVRIGLFFDGTNNNKYRDEPIQGHTNVVKLFNAHSDAGEEGVLNEPGCYRIYIPGVGTPFPENREWKESSEGKAMGKGAQARIIFALLQVYNSVYRAFNENRYLYEFKDIATKLENYSRAVEFNYDQAYPEHVRRERWFAELREELNSRLKEAREAILKPSIPKIRVSVFGFSRGAIEARGFCYWLNAALAGEDHLAGMPIGINFLGIFESVASVGLANSAAQTTPLWFANGHFSWAAETLKPLPALVKQTVHYIAAHEQRMNFPVTRAQGNNVREYFYPGVHSDVGGGYRPGDHGRGMKVEEMVSQVPLIHMHKAARLAGVPLIDYLDMKSDLQADYAISPALATNWNAYMAAGDFAGTYDSQIHEHMRLYYKFREYWFGRMADLPACRRAAPQEREDMASYDHMLTGDVQLLRQRARGQLRSFASDDNGQRLAFLEDNARAANLLPLQLAQTQPPLNDWEQFAMKHFAQAEGYFFPPMPAGIALLEEQIHDSLACFYLAGYATTQDKAEALRQWRKKPPPSYDRYNTEAWENFKQASERNPELMKTLDEKIDLEKRAENARFNGGMQAQEDLLREAAFTDEEAAMLTHDANGNPIFPVQHDGNAKELRSSLITTQTMSRREGGGYLRPRFVFLP